MYSNVRFTTPIAAFIVLLLLAVAFLYFRQKFGESQEDDAEEQARRQRSKQIAELAQKPLGDSSRADAVKKLADKK